MKRQAPIPIQKENMPPQMNGFLHAAVRTTSEHEIPSSNFSVETCFGHDFSQIAVGNVQRKTDEQETIEMRKINVSEEAFSSVCGLQFALFDDDRGTITNPSIPQGEGEPLPKNIRQYMSKCLGTDFSGVRIHYDSAANNTATNLGAKAFTKGSHIYFARNHYNPTTSWGRGLIAHELIHVMQQRSGQLENAGARLGGIGTYNQLEQQAETVEQTIQRDEAAILEDIIPSEEVIQCSYSETLQAMRVVASGGVTAIAQWLIGRLASTHATIARLSHLRTALSRFQYPLIFQQEDITRMSRLYQSFIQFVPSWIQVPMMNFTPVVQRHPVIVIGGIALTAGELLMLATILVLLYWLMLRANPDIADLQDQDIQDFLDAVDRAMRQPRTITETAPEPAPEPARRIPRPYPPVEPRPRRPDRRRDECLRTHPFALICEDEVSMEEVIQNFIQRQGYSFESLGDCEIFDRHDPGIIEACSGAPGVTWHCEVSPFYNEVERRSLPGGVVSIFGCLCCREDGTTGFEWRRPHWSPGAN